MFQETGKGGECMDCEGNKAGQHCDRCKADHYESKVQDEKGRTPCEPCLCDEPGKLVQGQTLEFLKLCQNLDVSLILFNLISVRLWSF